MVAVLAPFLGLASALSCRGVRVPTPEARAHPPGFPEATCVAYPPPAARPEVVGERPGPAWVWVDGDWMWKSLGPPESTAGKWSWEPGHWVEPPYGASWSASALLRLPNGALAWIPPHFHLAAHYASASGSTPRSSFGAALACPTPPPNTPHPDAGEDVHAGPALLYPADAPSTAKTILDAVVPADASAPIILIQPPD